jgi:hypothetical protein
MLDIIDEALIETRCIGLARQVSVGRLRSAETGPFLLIKPPGLQSTEVLASGKHCPNDAARQERTELAKIAN